MKPLNMSILLFVLAGMFSSCQKKQFFTESPEIELLKKVNQAAVNKDWTTYRSFFNDTASIYVNNWFHEKQNPDQFVERVKQHFENVSEFKLAPDTYYDMVIDPKGEHWVHQYTELIYMLKNGKEVRAMDHVIVRIENNKIVFLGLVIDPMPRYMAENAMTNGSLIGIHHATVKLKPGFTLEQYREQFVAKVIPAYEKNIPGVKGYWAKGVRGEKVNTIGVLWIFPSEKIRDQFYNPDGSSNELGKEIERKMKPIMDELNNMGTYTYTFTDWVVQ